MEWDRSSLLTDHAYETVVLVLVGELSSFHLDDRDENEHPHHRVTKWTRRRQTENSRHYWNDGLELETLETLFRGRASNAWHKYSLPSACSSTSPSYSTDSSKSSFQQCTLDSSAFP